MQSLQSICTEDQYEYGLAILNQYKLAIGSPAEDSGIDGKKTDFETLLMRCTTDLRQEILDTISIEKLGFTRGQGGQNGKLKQINAIQHQPPTVLPVPPPPARRQNQQPAGIGGKGRGGAQIRTIEQCVLCKGDHGLWMCPKIDDVKNGRLKMPPNVCYQHCNVKGPQCQSPCKGLLTYSDRKGGSREVGALCKEHGNFH